MNLQTDFEYLNGFLKAIEIAIGHRARVAANGYMLNGDTVESLAAFLSERGVPFDELVSSPVSREQFLAAVWEVSTDLMAGVPNAVLKDYQWQLEECLGLISTGMGEGQPFAPLLKCPLHRVHIKGASEQVALLVQFEEVVVVLFCEIRA